MTFVVIIRVVTEVRIVEVTCACSLVNESFDVVGALHVRWADSNTCWFGGLDKLQYQGMFEYAHIRKMSTYLFVFRLKRLASPFRTSSFTCPFNKLDMNVLPSPLTER